MEDEKGQSEDNRLGASIRGILPSVGAYLVSSWTFLRFVEWMVGRNNFAPQWVDAVFYILLGAVPSLILYLIYKDEIRNSGLAKTHKIFLLINGAALLLVVLATFRTTNPENSTVEISIETLDRGIQTIKVPKDQSIEQVLIFPANPIDDQTSDSLKWLGFGFPEYIGFQLRQNPYISPDSRWPYLQVDRYYSTAEKLEIAKTTDAKYYVDGNYDNEGDTIILEAQIRNSTNGASLASKKFQGLDPYSLIDSINSFVVDQLVLDTKQDFTVKIPYREATTSNIKALALYLEGKSCYNKELVEESANLDTTFAYANYTIGILTNASSTATEKRNRYHKRALLSRDNLPLIDQHRILVRTQLYNENYQEAITLLQEHMLLEPLVVESYMQLLQAHYLLNDEEGIKNAASKIIQLFSSELMIEQAVSALAFTGNSKQAIEIIKQKRSKNPTDKILLTAELQLSLVNRKLQEAEALLRSFKSNYPEEIELTRLYTSCLKHIKDNRGKTNYNNYPNEEFLLNKEKLSYKEKHDIFWFLHLNRPPRLMLPSGNDLFFRGYITSVLEYKFLRNEDKKVFGQLIRSGNEKVYADRKTYLFLLEDKKVESLIQSIETQNWMNASVLAKGMSNSYAGRIDFEAAQQILEKVQLSSPTALATSYKTLANNYSGDNTVKSSGSFLRLENNSEAKYELRFTSDSTLRSLRHPDVQFIITPVHDNLKSLKPININFNSSAVIN